MVISRLKPIIKAVSVQRISFQDNCSARTLNRAMQAILTSSRFTYKVTSTFFMQGSLVEAGTWNAGLSQHFERGIFW